MNGWMYTGKFGYFMNLCLATDFRIQLVTGLNIRWLVDLLKGRLQARHSNQKAMSALSKYDKKEAAGWCKAKERLQREEVVLEGLAEHRTSNSESALLFHFLVKMWAMSFLWFSTKRFPRVDRCLPPVCTWVLCTTPITTYINAINF